MAYDLEKLKMIAQGGEADIYDMGDEKILRIIRNPQGKTLIKEQNLVSTLLEHRINIPKVYEYIEVNGKPAEVMQKINGTTMMEDLKRSPIKIASKVRKLAGMHMDVLKIKTNCDLNTIEDVVHYFIKKPSTIDPKLLDFVIKTFDELPKDNCICHGDFHPGNILIQDGKYYIIDWSGAYSSSYLSDIAHTFLLMKHVPEIPGQSRLQHSVISFMGSYMAKTYLNEIFKLENIDLGLFSKWTVVMAFLRASYGMPTEKPERIRYLQTCYELNESSVDASLWYKRM